MNKNQMHMPALPPLRDFMLSAGFAGAAALLSAIIVILVAMLTAFRASRRLTRELEQRERHHQEARADEQHAAAVTRCWERLVWLVETAGIEPAASEGATLGLGPELALEMLRGLLHDAERLGDDTLARAVTVYLNQFGLVLAQQGGQLSQLAGAHSPWANGAPDWEWTEEQHELAPEAETVVDETPPTTVEVEARGRRHRG